MGRLKTLPGYADISKLEGDESETVHSVDVENESRRVQAKDRLMKKQSPVLGKDELVALADLQLPDAIEKKIAEWCDSIGVSNDGPQNQIREESLIRHHFAGQCILRLNGPKGVTVFSAGKVDDDAALKRASEMCDELNEQQEECRIQFPKSIAD